MPLTSIVGLDHLVVLVQDIDRAQAKFEALGFRVTPRGFHSPPLPTQNHTAVFAENYIELLYFPPGTNAASRFAHLPLGYEGPAIVGLRPTDSSVVHKELVSLGFDPPPISEGGRTVDTPDGPRHASWRNQRFPDDAPGLPALFSCGHLNRSLVYRPQWMDHPNGALGLTEIVMTHPEPRSLAEAHARLVGPHRVQDTEKGIVAQWGSITFSILSPDEVANRYPSVVVPVIPSAGSIVGATVAVASLRATAAILQQNGIATAKTPFEGIVPVGQPPVGTILEFREG
ncbi:VOC family protein [Bradyrhizobium erythrophlei]|uniref:Glyoxalase-like domain-containing protein n=1 Tax=Bradyrhizobium erythrophlei TaxID=1437360 RepID=A0A1H4WWD7_9BRAD|nr:VOC family protein [Bradyrhizobium erythrophlei]SEC97639.1 Glyoxalase-like domain-containing protein [Bradyrhizobium erythrophlei]